MSGPRRLSQADLVRAVGDRLDGSPLIAMFDIDGTLAPIAPRPQDAVVPDAVRQTLSELSDQRDVFVALVSGRSAADAWRMLPIANVWVVGNHGFEVRAPTGDVTATPGAADYASAIAQAAAELLPLERSIPGTLIEDKRYTLSLHFRLADPKNITTIEARASAVASQLGLRLTTGKKILELRPPLTIHKGTASVALADRLGASRDGASVMYAGDDVTDEDAFRALRERYPRAVTVRIADRAVEELTSAAEWVVDAPDAVSELLLWLSRRRLAPTGG